MSNAFIFVFKSAFLEPINISSPSGILIFASSLCISLTTSVSHFILSLALIIASSSNLRNSSRGNISSLIASLRKSSINNTSWIAIRPL